MYIVGFAPLGRFALCADRWPNPGSGYCASKTEGPVARPLLLASYFDCGTCGPDGWAGACSRCWSWSSRPPPCPPSGVAGAPDGDGAPGAFAVGLRMVVGLRWKPARIESKRLVAKKAAAR